MRMIQERATARRGRMRVAASAIAAVALVFVVMIVVKLGGGPPSARPTRTRATCGDRSGNFAPMCGDYPLTIDATRTERTAHVMRLTHVVRAGVAVAAAATAALAFPAAVSAHVTVNPNTATQGGYTKVTFRVPTERDDASTTKVEIAIPTDKPIASVSLKPVAGWTAVSETTKLTTPIKTDDGEITDAVSKITWTADANSAIKPHQFQEFDVSLGPLPVADQIVFKALQTYSDGEVVRWIDEPSAGAEAEHPAPTLKLAKNADATAASAGPSAVAGSSNTATESDDSGNGAAIGLGVAGLVLGLAGLVVALLVYRRTTPPSP